MPKKYAPEIKSLLDTINVPSFTEKQIQEVVRCRRDPLYYISNFVDLEMPGEDIKFDINPSQQLLLHTLLTKHYVICNKTRQQGITTAVRGYSAWATNFYENIGAGIISKDKTEATAFCKQTQEIIENTPDHLRTQFKKETEQTYILQNGSYLLADCVSPSRPNKCLRSRPITLLFIDEAAFIQNIDIAIRGILPTTGKTHSFAKESGAPYCILIFSTPNKTTGIGEWFFKKYKKAIEKPKSKYVALNLHWSMNTDTEWYDEQCEVLDDDPETIAQELDCVFLPSGKNSLIDVDEGITLTANKRAPMRIIPMNNGELHIFTDIKANGKYVVGVDTATNAGRDAYSALQCIDFETGEQVMEYMGKLPSDEYGDVVEDILKLLPDYFLVIENNSIGHNVVSKLSKIPEIYARLYRPAIYNKNDELIGYKSSLETTKETKPLLLESVVNHIKTFTEKIYSERLILQILACQIKDGKLVGKPNDLILALSMAAYVRRYGYCKFQSQTVDELETLENLQAKYDLVNALYDTRVPFINTFNDGDKHEYNKMLFNNLYNESDKRITNVWTEMLNQHNIDYNNKKTRLKQSEENEDTRLMRGLFNDK